MGEFVNLSEFMIDLAAVDNRDEERERVSIARVQYVRQAWKERSETQEKTNNTFIPTTGLDIDVLSELKNVEFRRQVEVLTRRGVKVALRDPLSVAGMAFEAVSISFVLGWIFYQLPKDQAGIRSRTGALYAAFGLQNYLILLVEIYRLIPEFRLFDVERAEGAVSVPAFLLSRRLSRLFLEDIPMPLIYSLIFYFMVGFRAEATTFFMFFFLVVLSQYVTIAFATLCVAISRDFAGASLFANLMYTVNSFACGYFVNADQIPVYTRWLKWIVSDYSAKKPCGTSADLSCRLPTFTSSVHSSPTSSLDKGTVLSDSYMIAPLLTKLAHSVQSIQDVISSRVCHYRVRTGSGDRSA